MKQDKKAKKILLFFQGLPYPPFGKIRVFDMIRTLSKYHSITLVSFIHSKQEEKYIPVLKEYCDNVVTMLAPNKRSFFHRIAYRIVFTLISIITIKPINVLYNFQGPMRRKMREISEQEHPDIVQIEYWDSSDYLKDVNNVYEVIDEGSLKFIQYQRTFHTLKYGFKKILAWYKWKITQRYELQSYRKADLIIVVSPEDKKTIQSCLPNLKNIIVIPTGIDTSFYQPVSPNLDSKRLFFLGSMSFEPNVDAMIYFVNEIFPVILREHPSIELFIIGQNPRPSIKEFAKRNSVIVTGTVDNVRPYIEKCAVSVVPLRIGSGVKGKILVAMAMGKPVITTSIGAEGMGFTPEENIIIVDHPKEFAERIIEVLENKVLREKLARAGRKFVEENYSLEATYGKLAEMYEHLPKR